jgi:hypothetical protein
MKNTNKPVEKPTEAEKALKLQVLEYEKKYFEDFTFQPGSLAGDIFEMEHNIFSKRRGKKYWDITNDLHFYLSILRIPFRLKKIKGEGELNCKAGIVYINPEFNKQETILHEMIHAYEWIFEDYSYFPPRRDMLLLRLFDKLKERIEGLDQLVMAWANFENQRRITDNHEGLHGVLFMLKCFDLEIRTGVPFGAISGFYYDKPIQLNKTLKV